MTAPQAREASNADLLRRVERLEADVRRISGILAGEEDSPAGGDASAWIDHMRRKSEEAAEDRRLVGIDPPLHPERTRP